MFNPLNVSKLPKICPKTARRNVQCWSNEVDKMIHLQSLLTGEAKALVDDFGCSGDLYAAAPSRLQEHFGSSMRIVNAFLDKFSNFRNPNLSNPESYTQYSSFLLTLVDTFQQLGFIHDFQSTIIMNIA